MLKLETGNRQLDTVKNIIFDFGGVICDIDIPLTEQKFKEFGPPKGGVSISKEESDRLFFKLVEDFETGRISPEGFRETIRAFYQTPPSDRQIDETWNALIIGIPDERIRLLESIRSNFRIFILSNSNRIHYEYYLKMFREQTGYKDFDDLFEKAFFSFDLGLSKPDPRIFREVISRAGLVPSETLFIDDTLMHVESARSVGLHALHLSDGKDIVMLFKATL
jgi:putative hydrolase of the HAD superfamily